LPSAPPERAIERYAHRLLYGTDFPNLPYAWDRELVRLDALPLEPAQRERLFFGNAAALFGDA